MKFTELGHEITGVPIDTHLHPTQLYESFAMLLVFLFLLWLHKRKRFSGQVILAYALLYSIIRFAIEFVRDDPRGDIFGLTTSDRSLNFADDQHGHRHQRADRVDHAASTRTASGKD